MTVAYGDAAPAYSLLANAEVDDAADDADSSAESDYAPRSLGVETIVPPKVVAYN
jgi:hypothetical protein